MVASLDVVKTGVSVDGLRLTADVQAIIAFGAKRGSLAHEQHRDDGNRHERCNNPVRPLMSDKFWSTSRIACPCGRESDASVDGEVLTDGVLRHVVIVVK